MQTNKTRIRVSHMQEAADPPLNEAMLDRLVGYNCRRAYRAIMPLMEAHLDDLGLRATDFTVLSLLLANQGITQKRLSDATGVSPPNLAVLLDRLEQRGLLLRQRNPRDKRSQTLSLTKAGAGLASAAEERVGAIEAELTAALSPEERSLLLVLLQKLVRTPINEQ